MSVVKGKTGKRGGEEEGVDDWLLMVLSPRYERLHAEFAALQAEFTRLQAELRDLEQRAPATPDRPQSPR